MKIASQLTVSWSEQRKGRCEAWCAVALLVSLVSVHSSSAQLTLTGGNLTLVQEGPAAALAGAATPGVYHVAKSCSWRIGHFGKIWILPR